MMISSKEILDKIRFMLSVDFDLCLRCVIKLMPRKIKGSRAGYVCMLSIKLPLRREMNADCKPQPGHSI